MPNENDNKLVTLADLKEAYDTLYDRDVMASSDKTKLDGIETGAQVNAVTSVNSQTGAVSITPANIGALPISGGTLTGALKTIGGNMQIECGTWQFLHFLNANEKLVGSVRGDEELGNTVVFREKTPNMNNDKAYEDYLLPNPTADHNESYYILTSKSPVTIDQGGTGATTPEGARTNLGAMGSQATGATFGGNAYNLYVDMSRIVQDMIDNEARIIKFTVDQTDGIFPIYHTFAGVFTRVANGTGSGVFVSQTGRTIVLHVDGGNWGAKLITE